jgi:hypothetical protein
MYYFYTVEYYLIIKIWNLVFCDNMDRTGECYVEWKTQKQIAYVLLQEWKWTPTLQRNGIE